MVRVGFICEGDTEKLIVDSGNFRELLSSFGLETVDSINARGKKNLIKLFAKYTLNLVRDGAEKIYILTDKDDKVCFAQVKNEFTGYQDYHQFIIAVKEIEAWFLADTLVLKSILNAEEGYQFENPENPLKPFDSLNKKFLRYHQRTYNKLRTAKYFIERGFSVQGAANHPACNSAAYLLTKLNSLNNS